MVPYIHTVPYTDKTNTCFIQNICFIVFKWSRTGTSHASYTYRYIPQYSYLLAIFGYLLLSFLGRSPVVHISQKNQPYQ